MSLSKSKSSAATLTKNRTEGLRRAGFRHVCHLRGRLHRHVRDRQVRIPRSRGDLSAAVRRDHHGCREALSGRLFALQHHGDGAWAPTASRRTATRRSSPRSISRCVIGHDRGLKFRYPWIIPGIGSTNIAKNNWEGLAIGSALCGHRADDRRERRRHGSRGRHPERPGDGHGRSEAPGDALQGLPARRIRRDHRPGQHRGHAPGRPGVRHREARRGVRRAEVGPGRQGHRRRSQDQLPEEGADALSSAATSSSPIRPIPWSSRPSSAGRSRSSSGIRASAW